MRLVPGLAAVCLPMLAAPAFADCAGDIRAALDRVNTVGPYSITSVSRTGESVQTMSGEFDPPRAMHSRSDTDGAVVEMTLLDGKAWMKFDDTWSELTPEMAESLSQMMVPSDVAVIDMVDPQCKGEAVVDSHSYLDYSFGTSVPGLNAQTRILVERGSGLPGLLTTRQQVGTTATETTVKYQYGISIQIEAPQ